MPKINISKPETLKHVADTAAKAKRSWNEIFMEMEKKKHAIAKSFASFKNVKEIKQISVDEIYEELEGALVFKDLGNINLIEIMNSIKRFKNQNETLKGLFISILMNHSSNEEFILNDDFFNKAGIINFLCIKLSKKVTINTSSDIGESFAYLLDKGKITIIKCGLIYGGFVNYKMNGYIEFKLEFDVFGQKTNLNFELNENTPKEGIDITNQDFIKIFINKMKNILSNINPKLSQIPNLKSVIIKETSTPGSYYRNLSSITLNFWAAGFAFELLIHEYLHHVLENVFLNSKLIQIEPKDLVSNEKIFFERFEKINEASEANNFNEALTDFLTMFVIESNGYKVSEKVGYLKLRKSMEKSFFNFLFSSNRKFKKPKPESMQFNVSKELLTWDLFRPSKKDETIKKEQAFWKEFFSKILSGKIGTLVDMSNLQGILWLYLESYENINANLLLELFTNIFKEFYTPINVENDIKYLLKHANNYIIILSSYMNALKQKEFTFNNLSGNINDLFYGLKDKKIILNSPEDLGVNFGQLSENVEIIIKKGKNMLYNFLDKSKNAKVTILECEDIESNFLSLSYNANVIIVSCKNINSSVASFSKNITITINACDKIGTYCFNNCQNPNITIDKCNFIDHDFGISNTTKLGISNAPKNSINIVKCGDIAYNFCKDSKNLNLAINTCANIGKGFIEESKKSTVEIIECNDIADNFANNIEETNITIKKCGNIGESFAENMKSGKIKVENCESCSSTKFDPKKVTINCINKKQK